MADESLRVSGVQSDSVKTQGPLAAGKLQAYAITQEPSEESLSECVDAAFNPRTMARRFETLETKVRKKGGGEEEETKAEKKAHRVANF